MFEVVKEIERRWWGGSDAGGYLLPEYINFKFSSIAEAYNKFNEIIQAAGPDSIQVVILSGEGEQTKILKVHSFEEKNDY